MNTEITVHPKLQHYRADDGQPGRHDRLVPQGGGHHGQPSFGGASRRRAGAVLGRRIHQQRRGPIIASCSSRYPASPSIRQEPPRAAAARRLRIPDTRRSARHLCPAQGLRHLAGVRLRRRLRRRRSITQDPDQNLVELNVNNYGNEWTATEHMKTSPSIDKRPRRADIDPDKMIAARKAGASPWEVHERAFAGEFAPTKPYDYRTFL